MQGCPNTDVYLINRGPSSALDGGIPEEAWTSKKVNYSFSITFGYGVDDFGYRLWDYGNHKIISTRDVVFNEKVMY